MTTATATSAAKVKTSGKRRALENRIVIDAVSWRDYERLGRVLQDRPLRITYDRGSLEIMTLSAEHESFKHLFGQMIVLLAMELGMSFRGFGSMTCKRRLKKRGLEPDECYWIQNEPAVRGTDRIDLEKVPPPDLILEVEVTRAALPRMAIYADLQVPEVWRFDGTKLTVWKREAKSYAKSDRSLAFPFLNPAVLVQFWKRRHELGEALLLREFQKWVRVQIASDWPNGGASSRG